MIFQTAAVLVFLFAPLAAFARPSKVHDQPDITMDQARTAALGRVPGKVEVSGAGD